MSKNACFVKGHFVSPPTDDEKRNLFGNTVSNVVIEISSYCNRHCTYCPVSQVDRSSTNSILPDIVFDRIIKDLVQIDYSGGVCLNLYNEPMANRQLLLSRIRSVRHQLPRSRIYFSTNGDYLNLEYLKEMVDAGLSELYVTLHAPKGKPYNDAYVVSRFCELSARLNKTIKVTTVATNQTVQGVVSLYGITINVFSTNYDIFGSDRAGSISTLTAIATARTAPCDRPFNDFTISYDGTIFPCCQMFADNVSHKSSYAIGNIADFSSIFEAYASSTMAGWRSSLLRFGPKKSPCDTCTEANRDGSEEEQHERDRIYMQFVGSLDEIKREVKPKKFFRIFQGFVK